MSQHLSTSPVRDEDDMKLGDLVMFRNCEQVGQMGVVAVCTDMSPIAKSNPGLRLYWVFCAGDVKCFTGNQLVLV